MYDRYFGEMVEFLRDNPYGLKLDDLVEKTVNEIFYSGSFRHLAAGDRRSEPARLWTTDADLIPLEQAQAPHEAEIRLPVLDHGTANALALWFSAELAPGIPLAVGPGDPPTHWGMTTAPLRSARGAHARHGRPRAESGPPRLGRSGHGRAGPSHCRAPTGRSTTSRRSGRRSKTEQSQPRGADANPTTWLPPSVMTARFEHFDLWRGGSYRLVLTYTDDSGARGRLDNAHVAYLAAAGRGNQAYDHAARRSCGAGRDPHQCEPAVSRSSKAAGSMSAYTCSGGAAITREALSVRGTR